MVLKATVHPKLQIKLYFNHHLALLVLSCFKMTIQLVMTKTLTGYDVLVNVKVSLPRHLKSYLHSKCHISANDT